MKCSCCRSLLAIPPALFRCRSMALSRSSDYQVRSLYCFDTTSAKLNRPLATLGFSFSFCSHAIANFSMHLHTYCCTYFFRNSAFFAFDIHRSLLYSICLIFRLSIKFFVCHCSAIGCYNGHAIEGIIFTTNKL